MELQRIPREFSDLKFFIRALFYFFNIVGVQATRLREVIPSADTHLEDQRMYAEDPEVTRKNRHSKLLAM